MWYPSPSSDELYHYGVLGMRWGIRRYQNYDGTRKAAGKKHEAEQRKGLSDDQRKMIRNVAIASSVAVGIAAGAYFCNRYANMNLDKVIKAGTDIQHMSRITDELLDKPFYASYLKSDNKKYVQNDFLGSNWKSKMTVSSSKDLKIAGKKNAEKIYNEWKETDKEAKARFGNQSYFSFNRNLNSPDMRDKELYNRYFNKLKDKGYDAIHDANDQFQSGIIAPLLIFGSLKDINVSDIQKLKE